jgi:hypothetical protein
MTFWIFQEIAIIRVSGLGFLPRVAYRYGTVSLPQGCSSF